jgi:hypothetical protein
MSFHQPVLIQPGAGDPSLITTGQEFRNYTAALLSANTGLPFSSAGGPGGVPDAGWSASANTGSCVVTQRGAGANFSVDVSAGWVFIIGTDVSGQSVYASWNDSTVNVVTPSAPGTGTRVHRLIVQLQDKFSLGSWTGYQAVPVILQDTGSGTPAAGNSAITLATISITAGQSSVLNANITDLRRNVGPCLAFKTADSSKSNTTLATDADLQLWGLAHNAWYAVTGDIQYNGGTNGSSDLKFTFASPQVYSGGFQYMHLGVSISTFLGYGNSAWADTNASGTNGSGTANDVRMFIAGSLFTGTVTPNNWVALQWAQNTGSGTATIIRQGSWLKAERVF